MLWSEQPIWSVGSFFADCEDTTRALFTDLKMSLMAANEAVAAPSLPSVDSLGVPEALSAKTEYQSIAFG